MVGYHYYRPILLLSSLFAFFGSNDSFSWLARYGCEIKGKRRRFKSSKKCSKYREDGVHQSIYTSVYRGIVNAPLGATQQRLDLLSTTHFQMGVPSAHTFNPPSAKTDIPTSVKSGDVDVKAKGTGNAGKGAIGGFRN